jgi:hypothetical protein
MRLAPSLIACWIGFALIDQGVATAQTAPESKSKMPADAAKAAALPTNFKGEWIGIFNPQTQKQQAQAVEMHVSSNENGRITGTYTRWVNFPGSPENLCWKADKLPLSGTYDGQRLAVTVKASNNSPACKDLSMTFTRGKDHYFERQATDGKWRMYLDPAN